MNRRLVQPRRAASLAVSTRMTPAVPRMVSLLALVAMLLAALIAAGCGDGEAAGPSGPGGPGGPGGFGGFGGPAVTPAVEVVQAQLGSLPLEERLVGTVRADNQVEIYPELTAPIAEVLVRTGDVVRKGQVLVRLEARQFREQLNQAKASLRIAEADAKQAEARMRELVLQLERTESLAAKELVSALEFETQRAQTDAARASYERSLAQVDQARAIVEERETNLARTNILSPISGRVGLSNAEVGMRAAANEALFTIGNLERVRVEIPLTESMLGYIETGQTVRISSDNWPDTAVVWKLTRISPFLEDVSFSTTAEIEVSNAGGLFNPGMFVNVDVFYGESQQATLVPNSALYEDPNSGVMGVFVATTLGVEMEVIMPESENEPAPLSEPTPLQFHAVQVVAEGHDITGISGIDPNAWVVTLGQHLLRGEKPQARARATTWKRLVALQNLKREDLLEQFLEKQQQVAKSGGIFKNSSLETSP